MTMAAPGLAEGTAYLLGQKESQVSRHVMLGENPASVRIHAEEIQ